ncbi:hypothetical protein PFISCL1PPCAC_19324, partial [Pristionchus fissidentatus]
WSTMAAPAVATPQPQIQSRPDRLRAPTVQQALHSFLYDSHGPSLDNTIAEAEKKTGMKREQLFFITLAVISLYLIFGDLAHTVCNLIGVVYPSYISVKAIRSDEKTDDTKWLIYWTVFGFFSLFDSFAEGIMRVIPIYFFAKACFLMYLYMPQTDGAEVLYVNYVDPAVTLFDNLRLGTSKTTEKAAEQKKK